MKNAAMNIHVQVFSCLETRLVGDRFRLDLWRVPRLLAEASAHCYFPSVCGGAGPSMLLSIPKSSFAAFQILIRQ